jgi:hypothetical protein
MKITLKKTTANMIEARRKKFEERRNLPPIFGRDQTVAPTVRRSPDLVGPKPITFFLELKKTITF